MRRNREKKLRSSIRGLKIQRNVISALVYRELKTRVNEVKLGFIGVLVEPVGVFAVFLIVFTFINNNRATISTPLFLLPGILLFSVFTEIAIRSMNAMDANEALFYYQPVKPIDTVLARAIVEAGIWGLIFIIMLSAIFAYNEEILLDNIPMIVAAFLCVVVFSTALGVVLMILGARSPFFKQITPFIIRPGFIVSGVFFSLQYLPQQWRPWFSWNPIFQGIELTRRAFSTDYYIDTVAISFQYLFSITLIAVPASLWIYLRNERSLLKR